MKNQEPQPELPETVTAGTVFIVDYDLPANNSRRRFYRRIQRWLKANGTDETAAWSTQSVVITANRKGRNCGGVFFITSIHTL